MKKNNVNNQKPKERSWPVPVFILLIISLITAAVAFFIYMDPFKLDLLELDPVKEEETVELPSVPMPLMYCDKDTQLWGYIETNGEYVIEPQFDYARGLTSGDGLARVRVNGKWGYINSSGKIVIEPQFDYAYPFHEGIAVVYDGEEYGYINTAGKVIINYKFSDAGHFNNGAAAVRSGSKWGLIDKSGKYIIDPVYDVMSDFSNEGFESDYVRAARKELNDQYDPDYVDIHYNDKNFNENDIRVKDYTYKCGYIDKQTGEVVIDLIYEDAGAFSEGLAPVSENGEEYGYIDISGEYAIPPQFDYAGAFSNGLAFVKTNSKYGYINKDGQYAVNPQFDDAFNFNEDGFAVVKKDGKYGVINKDGKYAVEPQDYYIDWYKNGLYSAYYDGKYTLMAADGSMISETLYDQLYVDENGMIGAEICGSDGESTEITWFDSNGRLIK